MFINLQIRLTSKFLGTEKTKDQIRRFKKVDKLLYVNDTQWKNTYEKAAKDLNITVDPDALQLPEGIPFPCVREYTRAFNRVKKERFESIDQNTIITITFVIDEEIDKNTSLEDLKKIFTHIGKYYGLSPWGSKFKFGRFNVESLTVYGQ